MHCAVISFFLFPTELLFISSFHDPCASPLCSHRSIQSILRESVFQHFPNLEYDRPTSTSFSHFGIVMQNVIGYIYLQTHSIYGRVIHSQLASTSILIIHVCVCWLISSQYPLIHRLSSSLPHPLPPPLSIAHASLPSVRFVVHCLHSLFHLSFAHFLFSLFSFFRFGQAGARGGHLEVVPNRWCKAQGGT